MISDREYPATHSMDTAWYVVDDDGNVGIMEYNDNGPVPWGVEQTCPEDLMEGYENRREKIYFNLTDEQILDMFRGPFIPSEIKDWFDLAVKIDKSMTDRFLELCKNKDIESCRCLSENLGLYDLDVKCHFDDGKVKGTLKIMIDKKIILEVYDRQDMYVDDDWVDDGKGGGYVYYEKNFTKSPYFIFCQPYWNSDLPGKVHEPLHPVKIHQIPEKFRYRIHKIPGSFREMDTFQIAQYYPCQMYSYDDTNVIVNGCEYQKMPVPDGTFAYMKTEMVHVSSFAHFCPDGKRYKCGKCNSDACYTIYGTPFTDRPTIMIIFDPRQEIDEYHLRDFNDKVIQRSLALPYVPRFPFRKKGCSYPSREDVSNSMTPVRLTSLLEGSKGYIESVIMECKPHAILMTDMARQIFSKCFSLDGDVLSVGGIVYPLFSLSALKENSGEIEELALRPFRGEERPLVISVEKMEELEGLGLAHRLTDND